jgi:putative membrane protein
MAEPDLSWSLAPGVLVALPVYLAVYVVRWRRVRGRSGSRAASGWRLASFGAGIMAVFVALVTPVDRLGEQLFVFHMAQHILLLDIAPILLIAGLTKALLRPVTARLLLIERKAGPLGHPAFAVVAYAGTLWVWHIPAMYELALRNGLAHVAQHMLFIGVGLLFWWHVASPIRSRHRLRGLAVVAYVAVTKVLTGILASAVAFSEVGFYQFYADQPRWWGWSALDDQKAAGGLMMTEELTVMTAAVAFLFIRMLIESEQEETRRERYAGPAP